MVRIVQGDFWGNFHSYEDVITRCFLYLFNKKFNNSEVYEANAKKESFNNLLVELDRHKVFDRFDVNKIDIKQVDKKVEQYLFKWTEQILSKEYHDRRKRTVRFRRVSSFDQFHKDIYSKETKEMFVDEVSDGVDTDLMATKEREKFLKAKAQKDKLYKKYPTIEDIPSVCSEKYESATDKLEEADVMRMIQEACQTELERKIVKLKLAGVSNKVIGIQFNCTGAKIGNILAKLQGRYLSKASKC